MEKYKYPVIIDTDIGDDIDDTWALTLLIASNCFDIKAIVVSNYDTDYKVRLVAKLLNTYKREDILIIKTPSTIIPSSYKLGQGRWLNKYSLKDYKGLVIDEKPYEVIANIIKENEMTSMLALGTFKTLEELINRYPLLKDRYKVIAMAGAINKGYEGMDGVSIEFNVGSNVKSARYVLESGIDYTMLPLDVCAFLRLKGEEYTRLINSDSIYAKTLVENYKAWLIDSIFQNSNSFEKGSSILFDIVVPWYLLFNENFKTIKEGLKVNDSGLITKDGNYQITYASEIYNVEMMFKKTVDILTKKEEE